ncbi:MAG: hypothetical protein PHS57_10695 [Alphaproteobacteria bacterium]|nr:hypothetical protein [Alphaproteobacteria bacterium]
MAHVGTTPNLGLPVWNGGDKPEMADFNDAFSKLDADGAAVLGGPGGTITRTWKFGNGLMIIQGVYPYQVVITTAYGSIFQNSITRSFPTPFIERPYFNVAIMSAGVIWTAQKAAGVHSDQASFTIVSPVSMSSALDVIEEYIAIGRWK